MKVKKKHGQGPSVLGKLWQDMVFATIGEVFEEPDVVGISVCIRKQGWCFLVGFALSLVCCNSNRGYSTQPRQIFMFVEDLLSVWNADNRNEEIRFRIGEKMKMILDLEPSTVIEYKHHAESMTDMSTFRNAKPYVFASEAPAASADAVSA